MDEAPRRAAAGERSEQDARCSPGLAGAGRSSGSTAPGRRNAVCLARQRDVPTICVLGGAGAGKSSTCNALLGCRSNDAFPVSHDTDSFTNRPEIKALPWRGRGPPVLCLELPVPGNWATEAAADALREVRHVHAFLIVFNGQAPRFDAHLQGMLVSFQHLLGDEFLKHVMIGFTRWDFARSAKRRRERSGRTEALKAALTNKEMNKLLGQGCECPSFFVDNALNALSDKELEEEFGDHLPEVMQEFESELQKVYTFAHGKEPFDCAAIGLAPAEQGRKPPRLSRSPLQPLKDWIRQLGSKGLAEAGRETRGPAPQQRQQPLPEAAWASWFWSSPPL